MRRLMGVLAVVVVTICAGTALVLYYFNYSPDRAIYPLRGVDVSHHQGQIDWPKVAKSDIAFAILKATEGGDLVDDSFASNLAGARAAGLAVGVYHFFTFCRSGADQAKNFLAVVPRDGRMLRRRSISSLAAIARHDRPSPI